MNASMEFDGKGESISSICTWMDRTVATSIAGFICFAWEEEQDLATIGHLPPHLTSMHT